MKRIKDESESEKWEKRRGESWWQQSQARPLEISLTGHACPTLPCASFLYQLVNLIIFFHPHPFTIFPTFSKSFPIYLIYFFIPPPDLPKKSAALRGGGRGGFGVKKLISAIPLIFLSYPIPFFVITSTWKAKFGKNVRFMAEIGWFGQNSALTDRQKVIILWLYYRGRTSSA